MSVVASSPDNAGTNQHCQMIWVRQAKRKGVREKPAFESPSRSNHQLKSGGYGLGCDAHLHEVQRTLVSVDVADKEATMKACGVVVAKSQGHSWAPNPLNGQK